MCFERELLDILRRSVLSIQDDDLREEARRLLERINTMEEAVRREDDPFGESASRTEW